MKISILGFFQKIQLAWFKNALLRVKNFYLKKPVKRLDFLYSFLKFVITIYILGLIFFAFALYKYQWENKAAKIAVKIYPFPAAVVDFRIIWSANFQKQIGFLRNYSQRSGQPLGETSQVYSRVLDQMIETKILEIQAKKLKIKISDKDIDDAWQKILSESGGKEQVVKVLSELYGMSEKDFKKLIYSQVLKDKIQTEEIAQVKVSHILIQDEGKAKEILERVKKGEDFAALAKEFSQDSASRDQGGSLDWFAHGTMVAEFENAAFALQVGQISDLVKSEFGFHIIRVDEKKGEIAKSFTDWLSEVKQKSRIWRLVG